MDKRIIFVAVIIGFILLVYFFVADFSQESVNGVTIETQELELTTKELEITNAEITNAEIKLAYNSNFVFNNLTREEYELTLYLSNINDEEIIIDNEDIYAYLQFENKTIFGESTVSDYSSSGKSIACSLIMDQSESMQNNFRITEDAVVSFVNNFNDNDIADIYKFGTNYERICDFSLKNDLYNKIYKDSYMRGSTSFVATMYNSLSNFKNINSGYAKAIVAFTDGMDNTSQTEYNISIEDVVRESKSNRIPIFTIGLFNEQMLQNERDMMNENLNMLATETGGFHFVTTNPEELQKLYNRINSSLRNSFIIKIKWKANELPPSGSNADLVVRVLDGNYAIANVKKSIILP